METAQSPWVAYCTPDTLFLLVQSYVGITHVGVKADCMHC